METSFFKRVGAYIIDIVILSLISSIITLPLENGETEKYNEEYEKIAEKYGIIETTEDQTKTDDQTEIDEQTEDQTNEVEQTEDQTETTDNETTTLEEINYSKFIEEVSVIAYDYNKSILLTTIIKIVITIAYFIGLQYYLKGQTLGKKVLKIKVVENDKEPSLKAIILRTIIIDSILTSIIGVLLLYLTNKNNYYMAYLFVSMIELMFTFTSSLFILYRKDKIGLHDMMANTKVIEVKE